MPFKNRTNGKRRNAAGINIRKLRLLKEISQRQLADDLQLMGYEITKNAIQRIESGQRSIPDHELRYFCRYFNKTAEELWAD